MLGLPSSAESIISSFIEWNLMPRSSSSSTAAMARVKRSSRDQRSNDQTSSRSHPRSGS